METININLIVKHPQGEKWENAGEHSLPVLPRIGEHIALTGNNGNKMYRVVTVIHAVPFAGLTEVFAVYDGSLHEVQDRLLS